MVTARQCVSLIIFSFLLHLAGYYVLLHKIEPFLYYFYLTAWWSYIFFIDAILAMKTKRLLVLNRRLPFLIVISCGFWCLFEIINIRLQNWFYINLPGKMYYRYTGYLLAYGTVIPALYVTKEFIRTMLGEIRMKPFHVKNYTFYSILLGIITFFFTWFFPDYFFPLTWIFLALILDGYNYRKGYASFMRDFEEGNATHFVATIISGLVCGLLWEAWNSLSVSKWVYSVPFLEDVKIFEMPVPGYIGFLVFGLETITFVSLLDGIKSYRASIPVIALISILFSALSFTLIDRYTVFSCAPEIEDIAFIGKEKLNYLKMIGVRTSFGINMNLLSLQEREDLKLLHLKGLGLQKFLKLKDQGIQNIGDLSRLDDTALSKILDEDNMRRVRLYIKAAKNSE
ncbi:MAG: hypothetical protein NTX75_15410 [Proteobacteria bacterium]|nr:hypothetical protein [Pseudomonadota bacterium]